MTPLESCNEEADERCLPGQGAGEGSRRVTQKAVRVKKRPAKRNGTNKDLIGRGRGTYFKR